VEVEGVDIRQESAGGKRSEPKSGLEGSDRRVREPWVGTEEDGGGPRWGLS